MKTKPTNATAKPTKPTTKPTTRRKKVTSARTKGTHSVYVVQRTDKDGNFVGSEYRQPYKIWIEDGDSLKIVRRFAGSLNSKEEAIEKAAKKIAENEAWWQAKNAGRTTASPTTLNKGLEDEIAEVDVEDEDADDDMYATLSDPTLAQAATELIEGSKRYRNGEYKGVKQSVRKRYQNYVNHMLDPKTGAIGNRKMAKLTPAVVRGWFAKFCETHSESTAFRFRAWLVRLGKKGVENEYWEKNLFAQLPELSKTITSEKRILTFEEIDLIWNAADNRMKAILVLVRLGLRIGEALGVTKDDILDEQTIRVKYTMTYENQGEWEKGKGDFNLFLGDPKTAGSAGKVRVPKAWMDILKANLKEAFPHALPAYDDPDRNHLTARLFVCNNTKGLPYATAAAEKRFVRLLNKLGFTYDTDDSKKSKRKSVWHMWRYTYCSELVALDANDIELRYCMRHTDANLSKTVYAQARWEDKALYDTYKKMISNPADFNDAICQMDEDRRAQKGVWADWRPK